MAGGGIYVDFAQMGELVRALDGLQAKFGDRKVKQIAKKATKPLTKEMKDLAPINKDWVDNKSDTYKSGTVKRSIASWMGRKGVLVGPRIGKLRKSVLGKPHLDGWYAHLALDTHKIRGGGKTSKDNHKSPHFIGRARLSKRLEVLGLMLKLAKAEIRW